MVCLISCASWTLAVNNKQIDLKDLKKQIYLNDLRILSRE